MIDEFIIQAGSIDGSLDLPKYRAWHAAMNAHNKDHGRFVDEREEAFS